MNDIQQNLENNSSCLGGFFFFQAEDGIRDIGVTGVPDVCSSDLYDGVGRATFDKGLDSLARRGMMVLFGQASGPVPPFDPSLLNSKGSLYLTRPSLGHYIEIGRASCRERV